MIYITGDCHREFEHIRDFCERNNTTKDDVVIILGDAGININSHADIYVKDWLSKLPITLFCIRGNHEQRPEHLPNIHTKIFHGSYIYYEPNYNNIVYAIDGHSYLFNDKEYLVVGGAYSVDKDYRLKVGLDWFEDEQLTEKEMQHISTVINNSGKSRYHGVLSHTCPDKYRPIEWYLSFVEQDTVDDSMEKFLDDIESVLNYKIWYCGHWHGEKVIDRVHFLYHSIEELK